MNHPKETAAGSRYLVVHPELEIRQLLAQALARAGGTDLAVYESDYQTGAAGSARQLQPRAILMDVGESEELSLDVVRSLHAQGFHVIGLYNPATLNRDESRFLRAATRAGVRDFITLPPSDAEVRSALESIETPVSTAEAAASADGHIVCFLSHKGGAGTSTLALNTAATLAAQNGSEVALIDADLQFGDVAELAGLDGRSGMLDLLQQLQRSAAPLDPYLQQEPETGLYVLGSPESIVESEQIGPSQLSRILLALSRRFDTVIVDLPRVVDLNTLAALDLAETIFLVTEPAPVSLERAAQLIELVRSQGYSSKRLHLILNRPSGSSGGYLGRAEAEQFLGFETEALITHDSKNLEAISRDRSLPALRPRSPIAQGTLELAQTIARNRS